MAGKEVRAGKAFVEIALRDKLRAGLNRAAARLRSFAAVTSGIGAGLVGASASIIGPLTAAVKQFSDAGDAVHKMAARTGLSAEAVSELGHAANLSGTNIQTLENGVRRMQQTIGDAASGLGSAQDALATLGLSAADLVGLSPDEQLARIADRIALIEDPALRTATAMDVFGRSGTQLIPMMADGAAGMQAMRDQAKALGITMSSDTADSAAKLNDALGTMWSSIKALTLNIGSALAPIVTEAANRISAVVASVTKFIQQNKQLVVTVASVAAAIGLAGGALLTIGGMAAAAAFALSGLAALIGIIGTVIGGIGAAVGAIFTPVGLLIAGVVAVAGAWLYFSGTGGRAIAWLRSRFGELVGFVRRVAGGISDALLAGDLRLAARILWAAIKVAFFRGVQEVSSLWQRLRTAAAVTWSGIRTSTIQAITTIAAIVRSAFGSLWQGLASIAGQVVAFFGSAMSGVGQAAATLANGLATTFSQVKDATVETFSAIGTALAHGEFALAGEIAWASIRLAFAQGIAWVTNAWTGFSTGLGMIWDNVVTAIRQVWNNVVSAIAQAILRLVDLTRSTLGALAEIDPSGIAARLKDQLSFDVEGAIEVVEQDRQRFNRDLDTARQDRDQQRVAEMQRRLAETDQRLAELRAARDEALARAQSLPGDEDKQSPLATAMAELEAALAEAAKAPKLFDPQAAGNQLDVSTEDLAAEVDTTRQIASQGTFNPFAIRGLGADSLAEKHFKATERVADNTARILKEAQQGGLAFA